MESTHPYADINTKREPEHLIYDTIDIKWG